MIDFEYYTKQEVEKISFIQMPRILFRNEEFKKLSTDSKVLYSFMQDRFRLSSENDWVDEQGRIYIYFTLEEIKKVFNIGHEKVGKLMKELEKFNLIERKKQGLGKPTKIYVKNCHNIKKTTENPCDTKTSENQKSRVLKNRSIDFRKSEPNYNNINYTEMNNIYNNLSINQDNIKNKNKHKYHSPINEKGLIDRYDIDKETIANNLLLNKLDMITLNKIKPIHNIMLEVLKTPHCHQKINGCVIDYELIRKRFVNEIKLDHLNYVLECIDKAKGIKNIRNYIISSLYNSVDTIDVYYSNMAMQNIYDNLEKESMYTDFYIKDSLEKLSDGY